MLCFLSGSGALAQGILIQNGSSGTLLSLTSNQVRVEVQDQIAVVTSTQRFVNNLQDPAQVKYAHPLAGTASPTMVRWMYSDSIWHTASMMAQPPDTTLPGVGEGEPIAYNLQSYLGGSPFHFKVADLLPPGEWMFIELTYVQLLPYANAQVQFVSASDYSLVLGQSLPSLELEFIVHSQRELVGIDIEGTGDWAPSPTESYVSSDSAYLHVVDNNVTPSCGFVISYDLDPLAYGITCISNYLPDSLAKCDDLPQGFFVLLIEPEPTSEVVAKDFVIIIDRSGSMSGSRIAEARDAASFMVNNLNLGDRFNIIAFDSGNIRWSTGLQPFNAVTMSSALNWIAAITAGGNTNINGALIEGIGNFNGSDPDHARSLIFLTDGQDNTTSTPTILSTALQMRQDIAPDLQIFTFGVGQGFNHQLLNQLAVQNNGVSQFLEMANFSEVMNTFYTQIQNPVVLNPVASFDHDDVANLYPQPLMGLFAGQQLVITGRYAMPGPTNLQLTGTTPGGPVAFDLSFDLTGTFNEHRLFVQKIWAQQAIDGLVNEYYSHPEGSPMAEALHDSIVSFSMCYEVGSPFTRFADLDDGGTTTVGIEDPRAPGGVDVPLITVYPEPSMSGSPVVFDLGGLDRSGPVLLRLLDASGRLILEVDVSRWIGGQWTWDGLDAQGHPVQGVLYYHIDDGKTVHTGRLTRL
ncbi:MAG TPA: VWA domain-containing protein [Flavobacteriales bacterium]|nr:VWA domain-containing protein [Flavobacteriales bacterium]